MPFQKPQPLPLLFLQPSTFLLPQQLPSLQPLLLPLQQLQQVLFPEQQQLRLFLQPPQQLLPFPPSILSSLLGQLFQLPLFQPFPLSLLQEPLHPVPWSNLVLPDQQQES